MYSSHLVWEPKGSQAERFKDAPIRPVHDDILIAKLRPGQEIDVELHCCKGIGKEHAKWSPVSTASYRLLPEIRILEPITGDAAYRFQKCFSPGVIKVVTENGVPTAQVDKARNDTVSREVLRHKEFENKVQLTRVRDHFICKLHLAKKEDAERAVTDANDIFFFIVNIESTGIIPPEDLFVLAINVLEEKIKHNRASLEKQQ